MRFFIRKRRQVPTIIIVALIDVLIVLLIFLLVTTQFKQQPALRLALPETTHAQKSGANEAAPVVIAIDPQGSLRFGPEARPMTFDKFRSELLAMVEQRPDLKLSISADKSAPIGQMVKVMDAAKDAKIKDVKLFTKEAGKQ
jgi:biopolymer transport protein ExbD